MRRLLLWSAVTSAAILPARQATTALLVPKVWDEAQLVNWATPLAGLHARPTHISSTEYYGMRIENLRTYPVYFPGREPAGYWQRLQSIGPQPLIEPDRLKTEEDWVDAGRQVFDQLDNLHLRTADRALIAAARDPSTYADRDPLPDGSTSDLVWVPTSQGVMLSVPSCRNCHLQYLSDGTRVPGAPMLTPEATIKPGAMGRSGLVRRIQTQNRYVTGSAPFRMGNDDLSSWLFQAYGVPWRPLRANERLKTTTDAEYNAWIAAAVRGGGVPRWNGGLFAPAKIPDLIGIRDRKYIDHTATHLHRDIGDFMRYAALVSFAETADFGPHHLLAAGTARPSARISDEALYTLATYIYSLRPPANPNPVDARALAGQAVFERLNCARCHTPPLYTNNRLTLADGFDASAPVPPELSVMDISVHTDPALALETRKGTGYYKVPSLKGLWYRGHYLHDGSAASLEEMFDPDRVKDTHVPGGFLPPGERTRAIKGHPFGLQLSPLERGQLIAFLRTL